MTERNRRRSIPLGLPLWPTRTLPKRGDALARQVAISIGIFERVCAFVEEMRESHPRLLHAQPNHWRVSL